MSLPSIETLRPSDSSPSSSPPRDRFTTLPTELFDYICDIASKNYLGPPYGIRRPYLGSVSRKFLHKERIRRFRSISITSIDRLHKLYEAVAGSPGCGPYVGAINLSFDDPSESETSLRNEHLVALLERLPSLQSLRVKHFPRLTRLLSDPPHWFLSLPNLASLDLVDHFEDWDDPYNPIHWVNLGLYPSLTSFGLSVEGARFYSRRTDKFKSSMTEVPSVYSVTNLRLSGQLGSAPSLPDFYRHFPNVTSLSLEEVSREEGSLDKALNTFPDSTQIEYLGVSAFNSPSPLTDASLQHFSSVVTLQLCTSAYDPTLVPIIKSAFENLRNLYLGSRIDHHDVRRIFEENETLDLLHVGGIEVIEDGNLISHMSDAHVTKLLNLVTDAALSGMELGGRAISYARENKRRIDRLAKAKAEGTTYDEMKLDEMQLDSSRRGFSSSFAGS